MKGIKWFAPKKKKLESVQVGTPTDNIKIMNPDGGIVITTHIVSKDTCICGKGWIGFCHVHKTSNY